MKLLRGSECFFLAKTGCVAAIGNFDGVHLGHQALLSSLKKTARARHLPSVVIIFEPQPAEFFLKQQAPARLTSLREKSLLLRQARIDYVVCLHFNARLAALPATAFVERYLVQALGVRHLLVGHDFRFGQQRLGDVHLLVEEGRQHDYDVEIFPPYTLSGVRVSSTLIRQYLAQGQLTDAAALLGRVYNLCGRVSRGDGRGRQWGVPTANIRLRRLTLPLTGVYCVKVRRQSGELVNGVANVGNRPTVDGLRVILEVHLLDFNGDLYGEWLQVFFLHKLRDERKFSSVEKLIAQIRQDVISAAGAFETNAIEFNEMIE